MFNWQHVSRYDVRIRQEDDTPTSLAGSAV